MIAFSAEEVILGEVIGEATGTPGVKEVMLIEAMKNALDAAPPPPPGTDVQHFRLLSVELEHGGFVGVTKTRVRMDVEPGPLL